jgi:hypothetical protein
MLVEDWHRLRIDLLVCGQQVYGYLWCFPRVLPVLQIRYYSEEKRVDCDAELNRYALEGCS